jgi:hypothetical protein
MATTNTAHVTAIAHGANYLPFIGGCTCGWVGPFRQCYQSAGCDTLVHLRDAKQAQQHAAWASMVLPAGFKDWHQRLAEHELEEAA